MTSALPSPERFDERIEVMVSLTRGPRVLHVGACGNLHPTPETMHHFAQAALVDRGFSARATDINHDGIAWLTSQGYEAGYLDAESLDTGGEQFDTIFAGELIEHLSNPGRFMDACHRALKPDGRLVLSTPQPFAPLHMLLHLMRYGDWVNPEHSCWYDAQSLQQLLHRHGFLADSVIYVNDLVPEGRSWKISLLFAMQRLMKGRLQTSLVVSARRATEHELEAVAYQSPWVLADPSPG